MKFRTNLKAGAEVRELASAEVAKKFCEDGGMPSWHIGMINNGEAGWAQRGPGYGCDQKNETGNGIGHAIVV